MNDLNFYEVLNVKLNANEKEIKKAYRILVKKYHPDTYQGDKKVAEEKMQQINNAYDTLSNADLRKAYNEKNGIDLSHDAEELDTNSKFNVKYRTYYDR